MKGHPHQHILELGSELMDAALLADAENGLPHRSNQSSKIILEASSGPAGEFAKCYTEDGKIKLANTQYGLAIQHEDLEGNVYNILEQSPDPEFDPAVAARIQSALQELFLSLCLRVERAKNADGRETRVITLGAICHRILDDPSSPLGYAFESTAPALSA